MMGSRRLLSGMVTAVLGATTIACGGMQVRTDFDPAADFGGYTTFFVLEEAL